VPDLTDRATLPEARVRRIRAPRREGVADRCGFEGLFADYSGGGVACGVADGEAVGAGSGVIVGSTIGAAGVIEGAGVTVAAGLVACFSSLGEQAAVLRARAAKTPPSDQRINLLFLNVLMTALLNAPNVLREWYDPTGDRQSSGRRSVRHESAAQLLPERTLRREAARHRPLRCSIVRLDILMGGSGRMGGVKYASIMPNVLSVRL